MNPRIHISPEPVDSPKLGPTQGPPGSLNRHATPKPYVVPQTLVRSIPVPTNNSPPVVVVRSVNSPVSPNVAAIKVTSVVPQPLKIASPVIRPVAHAPVKTAVVQSVPIQSQSVVKSENTPGVSSTTTVQRNVIREMQVRVPNRRDRRFSVLRFHSSDHPDLSSGVELFMQRENNLKQYRSVHNLSDGPDRGGGTEFGREAKEEARLRKFGIIRENYRPDDQPWIMTVGKGKSGRRRFRGVREGSVSENVEYFVFCQCKDGNFDAYPVQAWYKMKPEINYRFLREDEAEIEYNRLHKTMNLFNVMIKRKLTDGEGELDGADQLTTDKDLGKELHYLSVATDSRASADKEGNDSSTPRAPGEAARPNARRSDRSLKLTDLEEIDTGSDADEEEEEEDEPGTDEQPRTSGDSVAADSLKPSSSKQRVAVPRSSKVVSLSAAEKARLLRKKQRDAMIVSRMRRHVKKRKARKVGSSSEEDDPMDEARDDSEVDDHEGDEVDYMTNSSSDEEKLSLDEREKIYEETGVDEETGLKALLTDISSEEEDEESKLPDSQAGRSDFDDLQEDSNQGGSADPTRKRILADGGVDLAGRVTGDLNKAGRSKHTTGGDSTRESSSSSSADSSSYSSSSSSSDSELDPLEKLKNKAKKSSVLEKLTQSVHTTPSTDPGDALGSKRKPIGPDSAAGEPTSEPSSKRAKLDETSPAPSTTNDSELTNTVRKYLMRKPITVTELLKKIRLRKLVGKNEDAQTALANVLRQLRPIKQIINGQHALSLKH